MGDIVQVIDRVMAQAVATEAQIDNEGPIASEEDFAQLRALRDHIERDRRADAAYRKDLQYGWVRQPGRPVSLDIALEAQCALLAACREVTK